MKKNKIVLMGVILSGWKKEVASLNRTTIKVECENFSFCKLFYLSSFSLRPFEVLKYSLTSGITNYVFSSRKNNTESLCIRDVTMRYVRLSG
jgi:hypothetical protein